MADPRVHADRAEPAEVDVLVIGGGVAGRSAARAAATALDHDKRHDRRRTTTPRGPRLIMVDDSAGRGADAVRLGGALRRLAAAGVPWERARLQVGPLRPDAVPQPRAGDDNRAYDNRAYDNRAYDNRAGGDDRARAVRILSGQAHFLSAGQVLVEAYAVGVPGGGLTTPHLVQARRIVLATGRRPAPPTVPGLAETVHLPAGRLTELTELPSSVAILGAGRDGCNAALALAAFGSTVTLVEPNDRILADEDALAAEAVGRALAAAGVKVLVGRGVVSLAPTLDDGAWIGADDGTDVAAERLILATGYRPATAGLDLDAAGVRLTATGAVRIDDRLRTTGDGVLAAGAVTGAPPGVAAAMGALAGRAAAARRPRERWTEPQVPRILLTAPDVVTVGARSVGASSVGASSGSLSRSTARLHRVTWDGAVRGVEATPAGPSRDGDTLTATDRDADRGEIRLLVTGSEPATFLGATAVGPGAAELVGAVAVGILAGLPAQAVADVLATPAGHGGTLAAALATPSTSG